MLQVTKRFYPGLLEVDVASTFKVFSMEWTIQEVARKAGTTSRTLRHYDQIGLLSPSHIGHNGYRYYDATAVVRLQRILLLRELGMGLPEIAEVLSRNTDEITALEKHREVLQTEVTRIARQVAAVEHSIAVLKGKEELDMSNTFDGFDHTQYKDEVEERWGRDAYAKSNNWWNGLGSEGQEKWMQDVASLNQAWIATHEAGVASDSTEARALAKRHIAWLSAIPGTPSHKSAEHTDAYVRGLAEMYVADERFAANYGGVEGAGFVRDALVSYLDSENAIH